MDDLIPLLIDGGRVGLVLAGMVYAFRVTSAAYRDATERYKITADEATANAETFRAKFEECVERLAKVEAELRATNIREVGLSARISALEVKEKPS